MPYVLIVDDDAATREMVSAFLKSSGYESRVAANGLDALEKVADELPDLIVLGVEMPVLDGYETLASLKSDCWTSNIPVIMLSAHQDSCEVNKALELGAFDYISKPTGPFDLLQAVRAAHGGASSAADDTPSG
jgi:CheY-like chemotaxis protein